MHTCTTRQTPLDYSTTAHVACLVQPATVEPPVSEKCYGKRVSTGKVKRERGLELSFHCWMRSW